MELYDIDVDIDEVLTRDYFIFRVRSEKGELSKALRAQAVSVQDGLGQKIIYAERDNDFRQRFILFQKKDNSRIDVSVKDIDIDEFFQALE